MQIKKNCTYLIDTAVTSSTDALQSSPKVFACVGAVRKIFLFIYLFTKREEIE